MKVGNKAGLSDLLAAHNKYAIEYLCANCGNKFKIYYDKGTIAKSKVKCLNCGCYEADIRQFETFGE
ncbi:MAG TPA: hypothetical protein VIH28_10150 [Ignavibacteriaceae bacterium]